MTETLEAVIDAIRSAFAGISRGTITIHEAQVVDGYGDAEERARARLLDTESSWEEVPDVAIAECASALSYLDPVSWRYYIPAYMVWTLRNYLTSDSITSDFTIYEFEVREPASSLAVERCQVLDEEQARAVCRFLRYMAAHDGSPEALLCDGDAARRALAQTWGRFCE